MPKAIKISSPAFEAKALIPKKYTCEGKNINPTLEFEKMPEEAKSLVLIMEDPDAPGGSFTHWLSWGLDPKAELLEGKKLGTEGRNDFGKLGYGGPCPPRGTSHSYFFRLYALDTELELKEGASRKELEAAMAGHILAKGELIGNYRRG
ncbi:MAG: YbhB/YbcL family Raf kinase inhibitor-like protein [Methanosarcinaceae archaeon]|nr:YbhB/YbcL family Raf kinase inhibitor-like protein [Methanosarcinaceae archaeon]